MRYYFQRPPVDRSHVLRLTENGVDQSIVLEVYRRKIVGPEIVEERVGRRLFSLPTIFVPDYYTLMPIKNGRIMAPINMLKRLEKGETQTILEKANQSGGYACALIFGDWPRLDHTSIVGFYDFGFPEGRIANQGKNMTLHDMLLLAVDDPKKVKLEKEILECRISQRIFLAGLEAQLDVLSCITASIISEVGRLLPAGQNALQKNMAVQRFFSATRKVDGENPDGLAKSLAALNDFKKKRRKEQKLLSEFFSAMPIPVFGGKEQGNHSSVPCILGPRKDERDCIIRN
jgi:hypothetical protein